MRKLRGWCCEEAGGGGGRSQIILRAMPRSRSCYNVTSQLPQGQMLDGRDSRSLVPGWVTLPAYWGGSQPCDSQVPANPHRSLSPILKWRQHSVSFSCRLVLANISACRSWCCWWVPRRLLLNITELSCEVYLEVFVLSYVRAWPACRE